LSSLVTVLGECFVILKNHSTQTIYQSTTRFQAMFLEIKLAASPIMEYKPYSGPEQCKYFYLYIFFYGLKVYGIA